MQLKAPCGCCRPQKCTLHNAQAIKTVAVAEKSVYKILARKKICAAMCGSRKVSNKVDKLNWFIHYLAGSVNVDLCILQVRFLTGSCRSKCKNTRSEKNHSEKNRIKKRKKKRNAGDTEKPAVGISYGSVLKEYFRRSAAHRCNFECQPFDVVDIRGKWQRGASTSISTHRHTEKTM